MLREKRKILKVGNSLGVALPKKWLEAIGVKQKGEVEIQFKGRRIIIKKEDANVKPTSTTF